MIRWFAGHPTAANLLLLLMVVSGLFALPTLKRETFPEFRPSQVAIEVEYRGATALDAEESICRRLIEALKGVENLREMTCTAQDNLARAVLEMKAGGDFSRFLDDVRMKTDGIDDFPARAEAPVILELHRTDLVAAVAVTGPMSDGHLASYAKQLQDRLLSLPGVAEVDVRGFSQRQLQIEVPRDTLRQHGLTASGLAALVSSQNVDMPAGTIELRERDVLMRFTDERRSPAELAGLVVVSDEGGGELTLGQIATIRDEFKREEEKVLFNGQRAAILEVRKARSDDALTVLGEMEKFLAKERVILPETVLLEITQDATTIVRDRLEMLVKNGVLGLGLVLFVMSLFFRPGLAIWGAVALPVAFLGALLAMALLGLSVNMITLVALLMALGIVMDSSIVLTDSIATEARSGSGGSLETVVAGTLKVLPGVVSSFITTLVVFAPLSFLAGELGAVLEVVPIVLIAALTASLVQAFLILPHHLRRPLEGIERHRDSRLRRLFDGGFNRLRDQGVGRAADWAVRWRYPVTGFLVGVLLASAGYLAGGHIGREAMREIDGDILEARLLMPQGTPLPRTEEVAAHIVEAMEEINAQFTPDQPEGRSLVRSIQVRFGQNASAGESGPHVATVTVDLLGAQNRTVTLDEITTRWHSATASIAGIVNLVIQEPAFGPAGVPIEFLIKGEELEEMEAAARRLASALEGYKGVYNVMHDLRPGKPELRLTLADGGHALGLTAEDVARQLRGAYLGTIADTLQVGPESYEIEVRQAGQERGDLSELEDFTVDLPGGGQVPLKTVAHVESGRGWSTITRVDGPRTVTVQANVDGRQGNAQAVVGDLRTNLIPELGRLHPALQIEVKGQTAKIQETGGSVLRGLIIGLIGIFVVLAFQFRSYMEPLVVMTAIPLAFVGVLWGHVLMGYQISVTSLVGAASLTGIVVNNSILLVHFIKSNVAAGMEVHAAAGQASRDRFRAILASSSTTIAGLLPLLAETSIQAETLKPLVISVCFGLLASTVLVLLAVPGFYAILSDMGLARQEPRLQGSQK